MAAKKVSYDTGASLQEAQLNVWWNDDGTFLCDSSNGSDQYDLYVRDDGLVMCECLGHSRFLRCKHTRRAIYLMDMAHSRQAAASSRTPAQVEAYERHLAWNAEHPDWRY